MTELIRSILEETGIRQWRITETHEHCAELYFIRKKLDIPRSRDITKYTVSVFRDFEENGQRYLGSSNALLSPGMTADEIRARLKAADFATQFVKNPWYEFVSPIQEKLLPSAAPLKDAKPEETAVRLAEIMFSADTVEDAFLNSVEIFVSRGTTHILGSDGLDVSYEYDSAKGELVAQCVTPADVEQYRDFGYDRIDEDAIRALVTDAIADVRARAIATEPPVSGTYPVLLTGKHIAEVLQYYITRSHASLVFPGYSDWQPGTAVQGEDVTGEALSIRLLSRVPYSAEGIPLPPRDLVENGTLKLLHGGTRFCRYAQVEPTGDYKSVACLNGTVPLADLRHEGVLEPVSFSDFQMDPMDGHFKGEIRLALLHHADGNCEKLTGGSVNGNLPDLQKALTFSLERYADLAYEGPLAILIPGVSVAGK